MAASSPSTVRPSAFWVGNAKHQPSGCGTNQSERAADLRAGWVRNPPRPARKSAWVAGDGARLASCPAEDPLGHGRTLHLGALLKHLGPNGVDGLVVRTRLRSQLG